MSYYSEPDSHIRNKIKAELHLTNYVTKKELEYAADVNTSNLAAKKYFIALKTKVDKLDINKLVNTSTSFNNSKTKIDDLDVGKFL